MPSIVGTVLLVQESRFRLLTEDRRGETFLLSHAAPIEPQDLPPLAGRRVRMHYERAAQLLAFAAGEGGPDRHFHLPLLCRGLRAADLREGRQAHPCRG
jgi:hypothetical protein